MAITASRIEEDLERLNIQSPSDNDHPSPETVAKDVLSSLRTTFGDVLSTSPSTLVGALGSDDEVKYWDCFAEVYQQEVQYQRNLQDQDLTKEQRQQILADVLVWAEITQQHYDQDTAKFVTSPHESDGQFQRIGALFQKAKRKRDLE